MNSSSSTRIGAGRPGSGAPRQEDFLPPAARASGTVPRRGQHGRRGWPSGCAGAVSTCTRVSAAPVSSGSCTTGTARQCCCGPNGRAAGTRADRTALRERGHRARPGRQRDGGDARVRSCVHVACPLGATALLAGAPGEWSGTLIALFGRRSSETEPGGCSMTA